MKRTLSLLLVLLPLCVFAQGLRSRNSATGSPDGATPRTRTKTFLIGERYINFPLALNPGGKRMDIFIDDRLLGRFEVDLQENEPGFWGFLDVGRHIGKTARIVVEECSTDLSRITNDAEIADSEHLYGEEYRPQYHFTSRRGWLNDPNGLIYRNGKYHLFYQHNPLGIFWGNMSWGHAESSDLIHWQERTPVLYPLTTGACFSGACFTDGDDRLKLGTKEAIVAFYLRTESGLSYAVSRDGGETFTDYAGNPVVPKAVGRERIDSPKPIYHPASGCWVAPLFDDRFLPDENRNSMTVSIYSSADLKHWTKQSDIGEVGLDAECPDLFPLPLDGDPDRMRWVLVLGNASYAVGRFDGKRFCREDGRPVTKEDFVRTIPYGHYYASMTWSDIPAANGRRIQIAWMKNVFHDTSTFRGMPFNQQMSLPLQLTLHSTADGPRLFMNPVEEVSALRMRPVVSRKNRTLRPGRNPLGKVRGGQLEIDLKVKTDSASRFNLDIRGLRIAYDASAGKLQVADRTVELLPERNRVELRIFVDTRSVEIVANRGRLYIPLLQEFASDTYALETPSGLRVEELTVYPLRSIWK